MKRRAALSVLMATPLLAQKPVPNGLVKSKVSGGQTITRRKTVPMSLIRHFHLQPAEDRATIGYTVLGADEKKYLLDDIIGVLCYIAAVDLGLEK